MLNGLHITEDGTQKWYHNNKLHRLNGPAFISSEFKAWWSYGVRHRTDGPAVEWFDGYQEWFLNGISLTESEYKNHLIQHNIKSIL